MKANLIFMLGFLTVFTVGCSDNEQASVATGNDSIQRGEQLFVENCQTCHPRSGRGDYLKRIPATLLTRKSEYELIAWIQGNEKHREMPNFDHLDQQQLENLADFLKAEISR